MVLTVGFSQSSFDLIAKSKKEEKAWQFDICSLSIDAMSIKEQIEWDRNKQSFSGYVDFGRGEELSAMGDLKSDHKAKDVLVILANRIKGHWKIPLGYFLCNGIDSQLQTSIIRIAIE